MGKFSPESSEEAKEIGWRNLAVMELKPSQVMLQTDCEYLQTLKRKNRIE